WALWKGKRGLPKGKTLRRLRSMCRRPRRRPEPLNIETIRAWAEAHRATTGNWPNALSGPVADAPGETWFNVNQALYKGLRGLPCGSSLRRLLGPPVPGAHVYGARPRLTLTQILAWGDAHYAATGRWPRTNSGAIPGAPGETWKNIYGCLRLG